MDGGTEIDLSIHPAALDCNLQLISAFQRTPARSQTASASCDRGVSSCNKMCCWDEVVDYLEYYANDVESRSFAEDHSPVHLNNLEVRFAMTQASATPPENMALALLRLYTSCIKQLHSYLHPKPIQVQEN